MRKRISNILWGLIFIIIGVGYAGNVMHLWKFTLFFRGWWTLFIIIPCLISIIQDGASTGSVTGLIIGIMLLAAQYFSFDIDFWRLIIPILLIFIGLRIIFQGMRNKPGNAGATVHVDSRADSEGSERVYNAILSSNNIKVVDRFTGANLNAIFGGMALDLRDAIIDGNVEISATAVFGGIDIYVPSGIQVRVNNIPVFGSVHKKQADEAGPEGYIIYLNSTTMFGGINIK